MEQHIQPKDEPRRRLHSIKNICEETGISPATAWRLIGRDILKTVKIGRRTFVTDDSRERLVTEGVPRN